MKQITLVVLVGSFLAIGILERSASAQNWPQWRGPALNGVSAEKNLPVKWTTDENVVWKVAMPGSPMLDTVKLARRLLPDSPDHKLPTLCQVLEIETPVHHRALPDAVSCWKVLEACVGRLPPEPAPSFADLHGLCGDPVTIPSSAPRLPKIAPRLRFLEEACRAGARITILYGENEGPSRLSISPRILFESRRRGYMEAECARSGLLKTYRLDRVHRVLEQG